MSLSSCTIIMSGVLDNPRLLVSRSTRTTVGLTTPGLSQQKNWSKPERHIFTHAERLFDRLSYTCSVKFDRASRIPPLERKTGSPSLIELNIGHASSSSGHVKIIRLCMESEYGDRNTRKPFCCLFAFSADFSSFCKMSFESELRFVALDQIRAEKGLIRLCKLAVGRSS